MSDTSETPGEGRTTAARFAPLWEDPEGSRRGRPPRVSRDEVVDSALAIADAEGLDAVSMRAVASRLGVGTMTLYSHVPGRVELIDAMVDRAYADFELPQPDTAWRPALETYARSYWRMLRTHAWLLQINPWRLPLAPHVFAADEAAYASLADTGLTPVQVVDTVTVVNNTLTGHARSAVAEAADESRQGQDYESYWASSVDFWENTFDPARFPTMTRLWSVGAFDTTATPFELRLENLLDTIGLLIEHARATGERTIPPFEECMERLQEWAESQ